MQSASVHIVSWAKIGFQIAFNLAFQNNFKTKALMKYDKNPPVKNLLYDNVWWMCSKIYED